MRNNMFEFNAYYNYKYHDFLNKISSIEIDSNLF